MKNFKAAVAEMMPEAPNKIVSSKKSWKQPCKRYTSHNNRATYKRTFSKSNDNIVFSIYKKCDKLDPNNYGGITLINTL